MLVGSRMNNMVSSGRVCHSESCDKCSDQSQDTPINLFITNVIYMQTLCSSGINRLPFEAFHYEKDSTDWLMIR